MRKREAKWKACGFDSSVLSIPDPWASRNLWFQQLTHSVRSVKKFKGPSVLKVPCAWPSILETIPEPLTTKCQYAVLSWLVYKQQSTDKVMALAVHLFKPRFNCSRLVDLPYINLIDQHEEVLTAAADPMEVKHVRAKSCFCSNNNGRNSGMYMGLSECEEYKMDLGKHDFRDTNKLYKVTFQKSRREPSRTLTVSNQILPGNVTIGNFENIWWICGNKAYLFLPYGWIGCHYMATLKLPYEVFAIQKRNATSGGRNKRVSTIS